MSPLNPLPGPDISVLMSCHNSAKWVRYAIESVLSQTFKNFEFVIVNDGSTDETWGILQEYAMHDKRIIPVNKKNTGLADSLNVGLSAAKGEWIARLDDDDLCEPTRLEDQFCFVKNHPRVVLLGAGALEIDASGQVIKSNCYPQRSPQLVRNLECLKRFFSHSSAFYNRRLALSLNGYNARVHRAEDRRLWLEFSLRGEIACCPKMLVRIRKHSGQISLDGNGARQFYDAVAATVCHFLKKSGNQDPSASVSEDEWSEFLRWVESEVDRSGVLVRHKSWISARGAFFSAPNRLIGFFKFVLSLVRSGNVLIHLKDAYGGTSLPSDLATKWIKLTGS